MCGGNVIINVVHQHTLKQNFFFFYFFSFIKSFSFINSYVDEQSIYYYMQYMRIAAFYKQCECNIRGIDFYFIYIPLYTLMMIIILCIRNEPH